MEKPRYPGTDSAPWKLVSYDGKTLRDKKGKLMQGYSGYKDAMKAGFGNPLAVAVRM